MSSIAHLPNGSAIHADIIEAFNKAVEAEDNVAQGVGTTEFWNFVEADLWFECNFYSEEYLVEAFEVLADRFSNVLSDVWQTKRV